MIYQLVFFVSLLLKSIKASSSMVSKSSSSSYSALIFDAFDSFFESIMMLASYRTCSLVKHLYLI